MTDYQEPAQSNTTRNIIIAVVAIIVVCCCCLIAVYGGVLLAGPSVGNVFSNIVEGLVTPVP
jgi:hypothetical protein